MDSKLRTSITKIQQDQARGKLERALKRVDDAVKQFPDCVDLYRAGIEIGLDAGETTSAIRYLKAAFQRFPEERADLALLVRKRESSAGEGPARKFLLEHAVRARDLAEARAHVEDLPPRVLRDLLQRTRMKRSSLTAAARGGYAVNEETMTNTLSDLILSTVLGNVDEVAVVAGRVLDARRDEAAALEPLLRELADKHDGSAQIQLVCGRCFALLSMPGEASARLLSAVRHDAELAKPALELLRDLTDGDEETPDSIERALLELTLIAGHRDRAAEIIHDRLEDSPDSAEDLVDLIVPHLPDGGPVTRLHLALLDAAAGCDRTGRVVSTIKRLGELDENRPQLLEWLGRRQESSQLSSEAMYVHAQMLLADGNHREAVRVARALCVASHGDIPRVQRLLEAHRAENNEVAECCDELGTHEPHVEEEPESAPQPLEASSTDVPVDTGGIEVMEGSGFNFAPGAGGDASGFDLDESPADSLAGEGRDDGAENDGFQIYDGASILGGSRPARVSAPVRSSYTGARRPLDTQKAGIMWEEEDAETVSQGRSEPASEEKPWIDAEHVENVAEALYASGAKTFFHVGDEGNGGYTPPAESQTDSSVEPPVAESIESSVEPPAEPTPEPKADETFEERFQRFLDGGLDAGDAVDLMEEAVADARADELGRLLRDVDRDGARSARVSLCEVEYLLMGDRAGDALEVLNGLLGADLTEDERKSSWLKTVVCQRMRGDFEAANRTLEQLVDLYPDCPEVERLAKQNYRDYLQNQCAEAAVLEKVTSLERDA
jgi:tetratricopeptide (TPR) repeat protein